MKLDKIWGIWENLDDSYYRTKERNKSINSPAVFLSYLLNNKEETMAVNAMKILLSNEVANYTTQQSKMYEELIEKMKKVCVLLKTNQLKKNSSIELLLSVHADELSSLENMNTAIGRKDTIKQLIKQTNKIYSGLMFTDEKEIKRSIINGVYSDKTTKLKDGTILSVVFNKDSKYFKQLDSYARCIMYLKNLDISTASVLEIAIYCYLLSNKLSGKLTHETFKSLKFIDYKEVAVDKNLFKYIGTFSKTINIKNSKEVLLSPIKFYSLIDNKTSGEVFLIDYDN